MLKKSASVVLASFRLSTYPRGYACGPRHRRLTNSAARTDVVLLIRRTVRLAAALLDGLFEHPVGFGFSPIAIYTDIDGPINPNLAKFLFHKYHTDDFAVKAGKSYRGKH
jgi:hypothetical protein